MSDDPETLRQIEELAADTRPLLVCDVDEVVLEFVRPFIGFLNAQGLHLKTDSFRLNGNIVDIDTAEPVAAEKVARLIGDFFDVQQDWQRDVEGAAASLARLAAGAEIVLLTAMPHRYRERRRRLLDALRIPYPLLTTESAKGPAIRRLRGETGRAVVFVDDIPRNLVSVRDSVPEAGLVHLMAFAELRHLLPALPDGITMAEGWADAETAIAAALDL